MAGKILPERGSRAPADSVETWVGTTAEPEIDPPQRVPAFTPPPPTRGSRARLFILLAVLIPVLAFATVGILNLREAW